MAEHFLSKRDANSDISTGAIWKRFISSVNTSNKTIKQLQEHIDEILCNEYNAFNDRPSRFIRFNDDDGFVRFMFKWG